MATYNLATLFVQLRMLYQKLEEAVACAETCAMQARWREYELSTMEADDLRRSILAILTKVSKKGTR